MIILIVDQLDVGPNEAKGDAPVAIDPDRPVPVQITLQGVKFERRQVHVRRCGGDIEQTKDIPQLLAVSGLDAARGPRFEKRLKTLVPESNDHR